MKQRGRSSLKGEHDLVSEVGCLYDNKERRISLFIFCGNFQCGGGDTCDGKSL